MPPIQPPSLPTEFYVFAAILALAVIVFVIDSFADASKRKHERWQTEAPVREVIVREPPAPPA